MNILYCVSSAQYERYSVSTGSEMCSEQGSISSGGKNLLVINNNTVFLYQHINSQSPSSSTNAPRATAYLRASAHTVSLVL